MNLKRVATDENPTSPGQRKDLDCWGKNPQAECLRVELQDGSIFIFPYNHFTYAKFERHEQTESLQLSFASHDVQLTGKNLRDLALALQKSSVEWIRELHSRQQPVANGDDVLIEAIQVKDLRGPTSDD